MVGDRETAFYRPSRAAVGLGEVQTLTHASISLRTFERSQTFGEVPSTQLELNLRLRHRSAIATNTSIDRCNCELRPSTPLTPPTSHFPPPTSHLPPPTSHLPPPTSHVVTCTITVAQNDGG